MLKLAVDQQDIAQVTSAAGRIRGAGTTVGAMALAAVCERVENAGGVTDWERIQADMPAFERELKRVNSYCEAAAG
jgi:HPt (histidine-containing phosphotransfer) domain-containing protein